MKNAEMGIAIMVLFIIIKEILSTITKILINRKKTAENNEEIEKST